MKLTKIRKYKKNMKLTSGLFQNNSVLGMGLALTFVIVPTVTLKNGVVISVLLAVATIPAAVLSHVMKDSLLPYIKVPILAVFSMALVIMAQQFVPQTTLDNLGIYATLVAVNSIAFEFFLSEDNTSIAKTAISATKMCLGFALIACAISAIREILAYRTIWDHEFGLYPIKMSGVNLPFFGFIIIGFWGALFRSLNRWTARSLLFKDVSAYAAEEKVNYDK